MTKLLNHSRFPTAQSSPTFGAKITKGGYFFQSTPSPVKIDTVKLTLTSDTDACFDRQRDVVF